MEEITPLPTFRNGIPREESATTGLSIVRKIVILVTAGRQKADIPRHNKSNVGMNIITPLFVVIVAGCWST